MKTLLSRIDALEASSDEEAAIVAALRLNCRLSFRPQPLGK
jgi:hypothetical protein